MRVPQPQLKLFIMPRRMWHRPQAAKIAAPLPGGDEMRALSAPNPDLPQRGEA
jgi:hypothetical protein